MGQISRRNSLLLGAAGAGALATGGIGLSQTGLPWGSTPGQWRGSDGVDLRQPEVLSSRDGVLDVELEMTRTEVSIGGRSVWMHTYNGTVPGPTLRLSPGDTLRVALTNSIDQPTNLHVHGLHVSPEGNGDNPFLMIAPGERFDYEFQLPMTHPTGTFWYHPHHHGTVADQIFSGLYGAIIVDDGEPAATERLLVISDVSFTEGGEVRPASMPERMLGREGELVLVNGQLRPRIAPTAGSTEYWRVINACVSRHLQLAAPGQELRVVGVDMDRHPPRDAGGLVIAPGNRAELLVRAQQGSSELIARPYDRGEMGMMMGGQAGAVDDVTLAMLETSGGIDGDPAPPAVAQQPQLPDLRGAEPATRRAISFTMEMQMGRGMSWGFDGRPFDGDRIDQEPLLGTVEEWTISNPTPMDHPFHLHVWPMQVVAANGTALAEPYWRDVVQVPAGETRTVRISFDTFPGRTVYHCHILDHEDAGMMGVIAVAG